MSVAKPVVGIIMGSRSDWPTLKQAAAVLDKLKVPYETRVVSAHRTPKRLYSYATGARKRGLKVIIAGAGGAAHLPGMTASMTELPVLGVPIESRALKGLDSLLSIAQMPAGVPVGTLAIGAAGATNAGLLAAQILALGDSRLALRILGGGQLGRMLAVAAGRLGLKAHIYSDETEAPAFDVAAKSTVGSYDDEDALARFAASVDVVTCEFENVPAATLEASARAKPVYPGAKSFALAQDRLPEKDFISALGIEVAPYAAIDGVDQLHAALATIKPPAILKTRRLGYDGKGQMMIRDRSEAQSAWQGIGAVPAVLEGLVLFEREVSVIAVRGQDGAFKVYDLTENVHQNGILAISRVPADSSPGIVVEATGIAAPIAEALDHVGVLAVELFQREGKPSLVVNEIAPRVHNSGHWTLDACPISQFENHVRAIAGWPLGDTARHSNALMRNLIGADVEMWHTLAAEPMTSVHLYGKQEARPGRKMGHVTKLSPKS